MKKLSLITSVAMLAFLVFAPILYVKAQGPYGGLQGTIPTYPAQTKNQVFASPSAADGSPVFRALTTADMPGAALIANLTCASHTFVNSVSSGTPVCHQPAFTDISGNISTSQFAAVDTATPTSSTGTVETGSMNMAGMVTSAASGTPTTIPVVFGASGYATYASVSVAPANAASAGLAGNFYVSAHSKTGFTITLGAGTNSAAFTYVVRGN